MLFFDVLIFFGWVKIVTTFSFEGGDCGGFTDQPKQCFPGLKCENRTNMPPDVPGKCVPVSSK